MPVITQTEAYQLERELKGKVLLAIRTKIGKRKRIELEDSFEDEAGNIITAFDKQNVYFDGTMEEYPLFELGLLDAIWILGELE